jgi:phosphatidylglycerol:prolipoprotein diacylglycerol transferase
VRVWDGGFSILGSIMGILFCMPIYLKIKKIPVLPYFDLIALFAPLLQAISRLGCLCAGCCHGIPCTKTWCITYTDSLSLAPLGISLHPTQLYSSLALFSIFLLLYFYVQKHVQRTGLVLCWYLILVGAERFIVDFWRADREFFPFDTNQLLSSHQYISLGLILAGFLLLAILRKTTDFYPPRS